MNRAPIQPVEVESVSVASLLEAPENSRDALAKNDLSKLSEADRTSTIRYLCARYGLPLDDGLITVVKSPGGKELRPYVTAAGVFYMSRGKLKSLSVDIMPYIETLGILRFVIVKATAITNDDRHFEAYGSKGITGDFDMALMKADTAARVRACKVAVGLSLMTYAEAVTLDETTVEEKEKEVTNGQ